MSNYCSNGFAFFFPCVNTAIDSSCPHEKKNKLLFFFYYAFFETKWKKKLNKNGGYEEIAKNSKTEE